MSDQQTDTQRFTDQMIIASSEAKFVNGAVLSVDGGVVAG